MALSSLDAPTQTVLENSTRDFSTYAKNVFSQFGEDGIVGTILDLIPDRNNWCCEFGAWDGVYSSNTYNLIKNKGFKSVLIEADSEKFKRLEANLKGFEAIFINEFVRFDGKNTLDYLLGATKMPRDFDFLSIDIDGNDYYIFESLKNFRPRLVCIEFNPTIPNEVEYVQPKDFKVKRGASALSLVKLARSKGYELVSLTHCNLIFVDQIYYPRLNVQTNELAKLRDDKGCRVFAFVGYDGSVCLSKPLPFPWHGIVVGQDSIQSLPRFLRRFISDYNFIQKVYFLLFLAFKFPPHFRLEVSRIIRKLINRALS